ncbi:MAG TPA: UvrD-helicase domain-containing protein [Woeseiaceae bacterium]|nr:UvrD-helicase domain-containing protein [Woeseiaceae bacterium]
MSAESRLEDDRRARSEALDVGRSFIVQAPAGSGKTELLIQRYLTLLSVVDHPEEVLAITFTRKAAQEMQMRVSAALGQAARGVDPEAEHQKVTHAAAARVLARDRGRDWRLNETPGRMRIQTLDALSAGIAGSLPLSSGLGSGVRVLSEEEGDTCYRQAAAATLDWLLAGASAPECLAVETLLTHLDNDSGAYIAHVAGMLRTRDQWLPIVGSGRAAAEGDGALRRALERNIAGRIAACLQRVHDRVPADLVPKLVRLARHAAVNLPGGPDGPLTALGASQGLPAPAADGIPGWRAIAELVLTRAGSARRSVGRKHGFPREASGEKAEMLEVLAAIAEDDELCSLLHGVRRLPEPRYSDEQWTVLQALFRLLPLAAAELRRLFGESGAADFIELAAAADRALGSAEDPGDVALLLDYRIRHLLIDEMQDTSIAQYRLLEKLVAGWRPGDGRTLFCVGDPMQSIYRFRDAEVGQFLLARDQGIADVRLESLVLRRNFRSCAPLVDWFNDVFGGMLPATDEIASGAISYAASVAAAAGAAPGGCRVHPVIGADPATEADCGLAVVKACLDGSVPDETVAVLVRSRTQLPMLLARLRAADVPYRSIEIDRLTDLPEIIDVRALTRALSHRGDRIAWLGLLRGPWIGLSWSDLHALVRNDDRRAVWELLHDELRVAGLSEDGQRRVRGFAERLAPFLESHGTRTLRETVERAWYALGGPLLVAGSEQTENVYRFFDVLERNETAGTLADVVELETLLDRERVSSSRDARLQIMTVHRAKGLEFDHVVLYGLGRRSRAERQSVLSWLALPGRAGSDGLLISPIGPRAEIERDPLHAWIEAAGREKDRLEQDRLLYVACTRARRSLHLIGHVEPAANGGALRRPSGQTLLGSLWPSVSLRYEAAFARTALPAPRDIGAPAFRRPTLRRLPDAHHLPPAPGLPVEPALGGAPAGEEAQSVAYDWVGSLTRQAGTLVHRWLKRIADEGKPIEPAASALEPITRRWAAELGVPAVELDGVCARVAAALTGILEDERGRWLLFGAGHAELPVTGLWKGRIESIVIDRVRIDGDGAHWIVDYKTGLHEGSDLAAFLQQEADRYRPQLRKYVQLYGGLTHAPLRTALYFPLLGVFLPVATDAPAQSPEFDHDL